MDGLSIARPGGSLSQQSDRNEYVHYKLSFLLRREGQQLLAQHLSQAPELE